jgi:hypothetical protein
MLFTFVRASDGAPMSCELRYHGEYGVEAQSLNRGELFYSRRFDLRAQAVQWAELERQRSSAIDNSDPPFVLTRWSRALHCLLPSRLGLIRRATGIPFDAPRRRSWPDQPG